MANTATLITGPTGQSGPNPAGEFAEEYYEILGDNTSATIAITARWLRQIKAVIGSGANSVVISGNSATLTFPANLGAGARVYCALVGQGR
jgi:hypothetical protein